MIDWRRFLMLPECDHGWLLRFRPARIRAQRKLDKFLVSLCPSCRAHKKYEDASQKYYASHPYVRHYDPVLSESELEELRNDAIRLNKKHWEWDAAEKAKKLQLENNFQK